MGERSAFIQSIIAAPADDLPRLAFADWLQDHGEDDYAEFIRVQIAIASRPKHKRTDYPDEPMPLKALGDKHYKGIAYPEEGFKVGDRIDLLVQRPLKTPKLVHGFRVYKLDPAPEVDNRGELDLYLRLDDDSGPWPGRPLAAKERELWGRLAGVLEATRGLKSAGLGDRATAPLRPFGAYARGFIGHVDCDLFDWLRIGAVVCQENPIQSIRVMDRAPNNYHASGDNWVYRWDVCDWADFCDVGHLPGYLPSEIWQSNHISTSDNGLRSPRHFARQEDAIAAMDAACLEYFQSAPFRTAEPDEMPPEDPGEDAPCELCNGSGMPGGVSGYPCPECGGGVQRAFE